MNKFSIDFGYDSTISNDSENELISFAKTNLSELLKEQYNIQTHNINAKVINIHKSQYPNRYIITGDLDYKVNDTIFKKFVQDVVHNEKFNQYFMVISNIKQKILPGSVNYGIE